VGGVATRAYRATRPTDDFDRVVRRAKEYLERLSPALRELNARLRVGGLPDDEAAALPWRLDARPSSNPNWTLRTDAGNLDVLADIADRQGRRRRYEDLIDDANTIQGPGLVLHVAGLAAIVASKKAADRPKDRDALPELHALAAAHQRPPTQPKPDHDPGSKPKAR